MRILLLGSAIVLGAFGWGCTFVTSCPTDTGSGTPAATGGATNQPAGGGAGSPIVSGPMPTGTWVNETSNLAKMSSECGNLTSVSSKPDEDLLIAGIAQQGLWSSTDGGDSWKAMGKGAGSATITNRPTFIAFDPSHSEEFWEVGIYNSLGLYWTQDNGKTFTAVGDVTHNDFVAIDFSDPDRKTLLVSEHEKQQHLKRSRDKGKTWEQIGANIPAGTKVCSFPIIIDAETFLLGCGGGYDTGMPGILRSTDAGESWTVVSPNAGGGSAPLLASDGSIYWASEFSGGMVRSTDQGLTWTTVVDKYVVSGLRPIELPDGRLATAGGKQIYISADHGSTWRVATTPLPYEPIGLFYSTFRKAFYVWMWTCDLSVPENGILRYDFDYTSE
jgi:photosystem II stability/assembly factor-like uncharacterized protein